MLRLDFHSCNTTSRCFRLRQHYITILAVCKRVELLLLSWQPSVLTIELTNHLLDGEEGFEPTCFYTQDSKSCSYTSLVTPQHFLTFIFGNANGTRTRTVLSESEGDYSNYPTASYYIFKTSLFNGDAPRNRTELMAFAHRGVTALTTSIVSSTPFFGWDSRGRTYNLRYQRPLACHLPISQY